jgi:hypothetical protein
VVAELAVGLLKRGGLDFAGQIRRATRGDEWSLLNLYVFLSFMCDAEVKMITLATTVNLV